MRPPVMNWLLQNDNQTCCEVQVKKITGPTGCVDRSAVCKPLLQGLPLKEVAIGRLNLDWLAARRPWSSWKTYIFFHGQIDAESYPSLNVWTVASFQNVEPMGATESPIQSSTPGEHSGGVLGDFSHCHLKTTPLWVARPGCFRFPFHICLIKSYKHHLYMGLTWT